MTDQDRARRIVECVGIFRQGCSNTIQTHEPWACEECTAAFLAAVRKALARTPQEVELAQRIERLERAVLGLADATAAWEGGAVDSHVYTAKRWQEKVEDAVTGVLPSASGQGRPP